ncbi:MAG: DUF1996 domain-containing protein [Gemmatimonadaceae bacterium]|nr:DUF1996 domain-containing protein [Gemmatimonadaceae bacterium]
MSLRSVPDAGLATHRIRVVLGATLSLALFACRSDAALPPGPGGSPGEVSTSTTTISVATASVPLGRTTTISVVPRDAAGARIGPGLTVEIAVSGGTSTGRVGDVTFFTFDSSYRAVYTGTGVGTAATVRATIGGTPLTTTRTLAVQPAPVQQFTFCSTTGAVCEFIGRRDVMLVAASGVTHTQAFYGSVPCAASGYARGFSGAPPAAYTECRIGEEQTVEMPNAMPGMAGLDAAVLQVPLGDAGVPGPLVRAGSVAPSAPQGEGSFRMTCTLAKMDFFDPIVYPGGANLSHLHMFFGNADITPGSTSPSLTTSGAGTCQGGTVNRTGYWVPAVFDVRTSRVIPPDVATIYYKTGYNVDPATIREIPAGLQMIAGDRGNVGKTQVINALDVATWGCLKTSRPVTGAIPDCPVGDMVTLSINFPQCWDGVRLDSPDHKGHMAYPDYRNPPARSTCPPSHPVMLPIITEIFRWPVTTGMTPAYWRLTSDMYPAATRGGYSAHADWMNGWTPEFFRLIVTNCLQPGRDCLVGLLGDGRELY